MHGGGALNSDTPRLFSQNVSHLPITSMKVEQDHNSRQRILQAISMEILQPSQCHLKKKINKRINVSRATY